LEREQREEAHRMMSGFVYTYKGLKLEKQSSQSWYTPC